MYHPAVLLLCLFLLLSMICYHMIIPSGAVFPLLQIRRNPYQYVHDAFRRNNYTTNNKFVSKDPLFFNIRYEVKHNTIWNKESNYCNGTFILLMIHVNVGDEERRDLFRQYVKQGMLVEGKKINYVFVVGSPLRKESIMAKLRDENKRHKDILISVHEDNYMNITLTHLDAILWVRDYCKDTTFVGRVDGDVWIHFGNLIQYLSTVNPYRFYAGGMPFSRVFEHGCVYKGIHTIPFDFPPQRWTALNGGAILYSRDIIPFINIGTQYMEILLPLADDTTIGEILTRAGIRFAPRPRNYIVYSHRYTSLADNIIFQHGIKDINLLREVFKNNTDRYLIPYNP